MVEELAQLVAVEGEVTELAAFEDCRGERDIGGLVEVGAATEHSGGDGKERFFGAEAIDNAIDGTGEVFGSEFTFPGIGGAGFFAGIEGEEAFFAEGREQCFAAQAFKEAVGEGGEALFVVAGGDAEGAFGGDEQVGVAEADEAAAGTGGAGADSGIEGRGRRGGACGVENGFGEGVGEDAEAGIVQEEGGLLVAKLADLVEDVAFVGGIGGSGGAFVEGEEFLRVHDEAGFGGDLFAVADREDVDAGGFELVDGFVGVVVGAEGRDEGGFSAQAGEVAGDHRGAAEEVAFFQRSQRHVRGSRRRCRWRRSIGSGRG